MDFDLSMFDVEKYSIINEDRLVHIMNLKKTDGMKDSFSTNKKEFDHTLFS